MTAAVAPLELTAPQPESEHEARLAAARTRQKAEAAQASERWKRELTWVLRSRPDALSSAQLNRARRRGLKPQPFQFEPGALSSALSSVAPDFAEWFASTATETTQRSLRAFLGWLATAHLMGVAFAASHRELEALIPGWSQRTGQRWLARFAEAGLVRVVPVFVHGVVPGHRSRAPNLYAADLGLFLWGAVRETMEARGRDWRPAAELFGYVELGGEAAPVAEVETWRGVGSPSRSYCEASSFNDGFREEEGVERLATTGSEGDGDAAAATATSDAGATAATSEEAQQGPEAWDWRGELERLKRLDREPAEPEPVPLPLETQGIFALLRAEIAAAQQLPDVPAPATTEPQKKRRPRRAKAAATPASSGAPTAGSSSAEAPVPKPPRPPVTWCIQCGEHLAPDAPGPCHGERTLPWHFVVDETERKPPRKL